MNPPSFRLEGKRALVAGVSKGIGLAAAHALVQAGAEVLIAARKAPRFIASCADIMNASDQKYPKVSHEILDVLSSSAVDQLFAKHGSFDIVVNNAGTNRPKLIEVSSDEDLDAVIDLNVKVAFYVLRAAARSLKTAGKPGSLINVSSQMGHVGCAKRVMYCASKHALEGMTKALARELGGFGIRVNSLCPTFIATEMTKPMLDDPEFKAFVASKIVLSRVGQLDEIMGVVVFLDSDASSLMTGSALIIDGGWTAS